MLMVDVDFDTTAGLFELKPCFEAQQPASQTIPQNFEFTKRTDVYRTSSKYTSLGHVSRIYPD